MLDIATGGGHVARILAPRVAHVVASDLTPEILHHAGAALRNSGSHERRTAIADAGRSSLRRRFVRDRDVPDRPASLPKSRSIRLRDRTRADGGGRFVLVDSTVPAGEARNLLESRRETARSRRTCVRSPPLNGERCSPTRGFGLRSLNRSSSATTSTTGPRAPE